MSRLLKFAAFAVAALSVVALLPQTAWAVEGMGSYKGSLMFMPYWNNIGGNRTYFRIAMDSELNDRVPDGTIRVHIFYMVRNPLATAIPQAIPPCQEFDRYIDFTIDDWELINVWGHSKHHAGGDGPLGWAYAYAVLQQTGGGRTKLLWDRFFSDTFIIDTSLGTMAGWNNMQGWGNELSNPQTVDINPGIAGCTYTRDIQNDEFGVPLNDVCTIGTDDGRVTMATLAAAFPWPAGIQPGDYYGIDFADTFYLHYFTERRRLRGGTWSPTDFSITPVHVDDRFVPPPDIAAYFGWANNTAFHHYQWDLEVFDHNEVAFSGPEGFVICHGLRDVHTLTNNITSTLKQGHITMWEIDLFGAGVSSEDAVLVSVDVLNNITGNAAFDAAFGLYPAHNRTTAEGSLVAAIIGPPPITLWDPQIGTGDL